MSRKPPLERCRRFWRKSPSSNGASHVTAPAAKSSSAASPLSVALQTLVVSSSFLHRRGTLHASNVPLKRAGLLNPSPLQTSVLQIAAMYPLHLLSLCGPRDHCFRLCGPRDHLPWCRARDQRHQDFTPRLGPGQIKNFALL